MTTLAEEFRTTGSEALVDNEAIQEVFIKSLFLSVEGDGKNLEHLSIIRCSTLLSMATTVAAVCFARRSGRCIRG
jgi:hypothetical protein